MNSSERKKLKAQYKERTITGGICAIKNTVTGKVLLESSLNIQGNKNRFEFCQFNGAAVSMKLQNDWNRYGAAAFTFEVLEELTKKENQTEEEFRQEIGLLKELWLEKLLNTEFY